MSTTKQLLIQELISIQNDLIHNLSTILENYKAGADIDEEDTRDPEDFSHQGEWTKASQELTTRIEHAKEDLNLIKNISLHTIETIAPNAVVKTNDLNFIVGVAVPPFTFSNEKYVGISTLAPIYQIMKGKKKGDSFAFGNHSYTIADVF